MNQSPQSSFMDSKTLLALLLLGLSWMGWQYYMQKKYPEASRQKSMQEARELTEKNGGDGRNAMLPPETESQKEGKPENSAGPQKNDEMSDSKPIPESLVDYEDENIHLQLSSKGMGVKSLVLRNYTRRNGENFEFSAYQNHIPLETRLAGSSLPLDFSIQKVGEKTFVGVANVRGMEVKKTIEIQSEDYVLNTKVTVSGTDDSFLGLQTTLVDRIQKAEASTFFLPTFGRQEFFVVNAGSEERLHIEPEERIKETYSQVGLASLGTQYFSQAIVDESSLIPEFRAHTEPETKLAVGSLIYSVLDKRNGFDISYKAFMGPKYLHMLKRVDQQLAGVIDFGFFSWLAEPMLRVLKWFHTLLGNWGVAIIFLTLLVRVLVLPFTVMSYKSMNKMKIIQPQIKSLREKYKDDQARLNQEMMTLMKENKVNPLGGCLPMLLQFPVFIALYQVLGQSIELYQAPFTLWISDLSLKDPYFVLPVLMGITMFIQQKITPNTMDPAQAKVLMFMPVLFTFFMIGLPSGLTLYIFISSLFAIVQQIYFMKDTTNQPQVTA